MSVKVTSCRDSLLCCCVKCIRARRYSWEAEGLWYYGRSILCDIFEIPFCVRILATHARFRFYTGKLGEQVYILNGVVHDVYIVEMVGLNDTVRTG